MTIKIMTNDLTNMGSSQTVSNSGHLVDYEFLPAVIVETDDPLHYGRIKVAAPGAYNSNNSPASHLPWCYPFTMTGNASYASYEKGSKVWLLRNKKRQDENWFIPMYELHDQPQQFINENSDKKPEVISMRNNGGGKSAITYDHGSGYNISTSGSGGGAGVNVGTNAITTVTGGSSAVKVENAMVTIGASGGGEGEPAVLGNKLKEFLNLLLEGLDTFADLLMSDDPRAIPACEFLKTKIGFLFPSPNGSKRSSCLIVFILTSFRVTCLSISKTCTISSIFLSSAYFSNASLNRLNSFFSIPSPTAISWPPYLVKYLDKSTNAP